MSADKTKHEAKEPLDKSKTQSNQSYYLNPEVKNHEFASFVRSTTTPHGVILGFGKWDVEHEKFALFQEILLPYDVADSLQGILDRQIAQLIDSGKIERIEKGEDKS
ncbi:hypothetical protein GF420_02065 [candidate division GN15 bacterium]|nr:hypothetical protein [candidate division GN15 bacterium]